MSGHAGMDRLTYPGDDVMTNLWNHTNLEWTGFYLAPAPSQHYKGWMSKFQFLNNLGWGFAPIYVGQQSQGPGSKVLTTSQGSTDANDAANLARQAGFLNRSVIYLDFEQWDLPLKQPAKDYFAAWSQGVFDAAFYPGLYCNYHLAHLFDQVDFRPVTWVYRVNYPKKTYDHGPDPDPIDSGIFTASVWQLAQGCGLKYKDDNDRTHVLQHVDFDTADTADPSNFLDLAGT